MDNFKIWLEKEEFVDFFLCDLDEANFSRWAGIPLAAASILGMAGHDTGNANLSNSPKTAFHKFQDNRMVKIANAIQERFGVQVNPNQIQMVKPADVIQPMYGDKWQQVQDKAKEAQGPTKVLDIDIPAMNSVGVTDINKMNQPVPVIYADPTQFGQGENINGFCTSLFIDGKNQKICVIKNTSLKHTLRHELSHATQGDDFGVTSSLGGDGQFGDYFMNEKELGVRLGELKRNYFQLTGEIVDSSDHKSFMKLIRHLFANPKNYSPDVQQLLPIIEKATREKLLPKLMDYFKTNLNKVVSNPVQSKARLV